jgi:ABC-type phosphate/phosphonate transport system substrate-binding protein
MRIGIVVLCLSVAGAASAANRDFVIEHSGAGGNAQSAQPYIDQLLRLLESRLGWPANSAKGAWVDDEKAAEQALASDKPGFAILDPETYLALRKKEGLEPIGIVKGQTFNKGHYSLVAKDPALKTLADLKGKKLVSNHVQSPKYIDKVAFDGKLAVEKDFKLEKTASPAKPIKAVTRGDADVALIDDEQLAKLKEMPGGEELHVVWTSPVLPPTPVVALSKNATPADRAAMAKALVKVCGDDKGKAVCESMFIDQIAPVEKSAFSEAAKRYDK